MVKYRRANIDVNALVGKRIQKRRKELGYTGSQLAAKLGVSQQQFSRYERGLNKIDLTYLVLLAKFLNTPIYSVTTSPVPISFNNSSKERPCPGIRQL